jgi:hypothetical protein
MSKRKSKRIKSPDGARIVLQRSDDRWMVPKLVAVYPSHLPDRFR